MVGEYIGKLWAEAVGRSVVDAAIEEQCRGLHFMMSLHHSRLDVAILLSTVASSRCRDMIARLATRVIWIAS